MGPQCHAFPMSSDFPCLQSAVTEQHCPKMRPPSSAPRFATRSPARCVSFPSSPVLILAVLRLWAGSRHPVPGASEQSSLLWSENLTLVCGGLGHGWSCLAVLEEGEGSVHTPSSEQSHQTSLLPNTKPENICKLFLILLGATGELSSDKGEGCAEPHGCF